MRIISGKYGSRTIQAVPGTSTRPTTDKVKEAIFSRIGPYFDGGQMLDLFAGSGAMSLEAISRGFDFSVLVDKDFKACRTIQDNIKALGVKDQCALYKQDVMAAVKRVADEHRQFDLIFMDPPYAKQKIVEILTLIDELDLLKKQGDVIAECAVEDELPLEVGRLKQIKTATYGITRITYFKQEENHE